MATGLGAQAMHSASRGFSVRVGNFEPKAEHEACGRGERLTEL